MTDGPEDTEEAPPGDTEDADSVASATHLVTRGRRPRISSIYSFKTEELDGGVESSTLSTDELATKADGGASTP